MGKDSGEDRLKNMLHVLRQRDGSDVLVIQDQFDVTCGVVMEAKIQKMMFERWGETLATDFTVYGVKIAQSEELLALMMKMFYRYIATLLSTRVSSLIVLTHCYHSSTQNAHDTSYKNLKTYCQSNKNSHSSRILTRTGINAMRCGRILHVENILRPAIQQPTGSSLIGTSSRCSSDVKQELTRPSLDCCSTS
ncbi:Serine protease [Phytophthora megakarya]|uniref:Serine protease n=1 Tax=Phytophthora megakarya TaxID=4795 RepID=A0A225WBZ1_9STRA|nr:Serine protease [Phytophthora megakarya]